MRKIFHEIYCVIFGHYNENIFANNISCAEVVIMECQEIFESPKSCGSRVSFNDITFYRVKRIELENSKLLNQYMYTFFNSDGGLISIFYSDKFMHVFPFEDSYANDFELR